MWNVQNNKIYEMVYLTQALARPMSVLMSLILLIILLIVIQYIIIFYNTCKCTRAMMCVCVCVTYFKSSRKDEGGGCKMAPTNDLSSGDWNLLRKKDGVEGRLGEGEEEWISSSDTRNKKIIINFLPPLSQYYIIFFLYSLLSTSLLPSSLPPSLIPSSLLSTPALPYPLVLLLWLNVFTWCDSSLYDLFREVGSDESGVTEREKVLRGGESFDSSSWHKLSPNALKCAQSEDLLWF